MEITVKRLIEDLQKCNPDSIVFMYSTTEKQFIPREYRDLPVVGDVTYNSKRYNVAVMI